MINNIADKYTYRIEWSEEDQVFIARCLEFPGLAAHGNTTEDALKEIRVVVKESINWLKEENKPVSQPLGVKNKKNCSTLLTRSFL
jgi:predicted RNase H-like HicB family nuclease